MKPLGILIKKENYPLIFLYILGAFHWYLFLNYKNDNFDFLDWKLFFGIYLVLEEAFKNFQIPYHASLFASDNFKEEYIEYIWKGRFFANEWIVLMPQSIILFFFSAKNYLTFQYIFFYTLMFYGLLKIKKAFVLSNTATSFLIILFTYNGKLLSQSAFGEPHFVFGWMLIPLFYHFLYKYLKSNKKGENLKNILKFSFIFIFILSQADLHIYYEMFFVGLAIIIFFPKKIINYIAGVGLSVLVSLWYVLPVLFFSIKTLGGVQSNIDHWRRFGISGYGHQNGHVGIPVFENINFNSFSINENNLFEILINFIKYFVNIFNHIFESLIKQYDASHYNTHEYNIYISFFGLIILILGMILNKNKDFFLKKIKFKLIASLFIVFIISIGPFHKLILQFLNNFYEFNPIEAVPSRFLIFVLSFLIIFSAQGFDAIFEKLRIKSTVFKYITLSVLLLILWFHSFNWWIYNSRISSLNSNSSTGDFNIQIYELSNDVNYIPIVNFSYLFSIIAFISLIIIYIRLKKK